MHMLEEAPEQSGRYRRFGYGAVFSASLAASLAYAANTVEPVRRALSSVVQINVVEDTPEPPKDEPLPPPPPPDMPKAKPKPREQQQVAAPQPQQAQPQEVPPGEEQIGLDSDSFGSGTGGPAFAVGNTQMGTPSSHTGPVAPPPAPAAKATAKVVEARWQGQSNIVEYPEWARRKGIQGLIVVETEIDERGKVTRATIRGKLDPKLDAMVRDAILAGRFEPATLEGRAVASTKFVRVRFNLE